MDLVGYKCLQNKLTLMSVVEIKIDIEEEDGEDGEEEDDEEEG